VRAAIAASAASNVVRCFSNSEWDIRGSSLSGRSGFFCGEAGFAGWAGF